MAALGCSSRAILQPWRFAPISRGPALSIGLSIPHEGRREVVSPLLRGAPVGCPGYLAVTLVARWSLYIMALIFSVTQGKLQDFILCGVGLLQGMSPAEFLPCHLFLLHL